MAIIKNPADTTPQMDEETIARMREQAIGMKLASGAIIESITPTITDDGQLTNAYVLATAQNPDTQETEDVLLRFTGKEENANKNAINHHYMIHEKAPGALPEIKGVQGQIIALDTNLINLENNQMWPNGFNTLELNDDLEENYRNYIMDHADLAIQAIKGHNEFIDESCQGIETNQDVINREFPGLYSASGWHNTLNNKDKIAPENTTKRYINIANEAHEKRDALEKRIEDNGEKTLLIGNTQPGLMRYTDSKAILETVELNFGEVAYAMRHPLVQPSAMRYGDDLEQCLTLTKQFNRGAILKEMVQKFNDAGIAVSVEDTAAAAALHAATMLTRQLLTDQNLIADGKFTEFQKARSDCFKEQLADCYDQYMALAAA